MEPWPEAPAKAEWFLTLATAKNKRGRVGQLASGHVGGTLGSTHNCFLPGNTLTFLRCLHSTTP